MAVWGGLSGLPGGMDGACLRAQAVRADSLFLEGIRWQLAERPQMALDAYAAALAERSDHAAACYAIASIKAGQQKWSEAVVYGEKAARLEPENLWYKVLLAQVYRLTMQWPKAVETLGQLRGMDSSNLDFAYQQSDLYLVQGDVASAVRVYDELERMFEPCDEWSMQKYRLLMSRGLVAEARAEIEKISAYVPGEPKYYEILAQMSSKAGDYASAYRYYQKILALKPDDAYTYASLADYYRKTGEEEKALAALTRAISLPGLDDDTRLTLVSTFFGDRQGYEPTKREVALYAGLLDTLLQMYPSNARLHFVKGLYDWQHDKTEQALDYLEKSLRLDPKAYNTYTVLLYVLQAAQDWPRIIRYAEAALRLFPESTVFYVYLTLAYYNADDCANSLVYGEQALKRLPYVAGPDHDQWGTLLYGCVGECYFHSGRYTDYMRVMDEAVRTFPDDVLLKNNYAYQLSRMNTRLEEAAHMARFACKRSPNYYSFWDTYAWTLFRAGDYAAAYAAVRNALRKGGVKEAVVWEHAGDILYHLHKTDKAVDAWRKALELSGQDADTDTDTARLKHKIENRQWIEQPL
ncbi:MAG: tetratricopeptide repeat protein [Bacteroidales bacterium]|nr:tetratricopeptide repeat protein [Bacteroidales bacterium]